MLTVADAVAAICRQAKPLPAESVPLERAVGRVLATTTVAESDLPPFDNSAMDGFAVVARDLARASAEEPVSLCRLTMVAAGAAELPTVVPGHCAAVMTGAPLPPGSDAVVPVEQAEVSSDGRVLFRKLVAVGANRRLRGSDLAAGDLVIPAGASLGHSELALLAAAGIDPVNVTRRPRVALVTTGDELVDHRQAPGPGQIRDASIVGLKAQLQAAGAEVVMTRHAVDDAEALRQTLLALPECDLVVTAGGVSMGERDYVRPVFEAIGELLFWRVAVKPGKPLLFGRLGPALFFGLPGNPVSSLVTLDVFVRPALDRLLGRRDGGRLVVPATMAEPLRSDPARQEYVRVRLLSCGGGCCRAWPTGSQSSGRLSSMIGVDGYAVIPVGVGQVEAGEAVRVELRDRGLGVG